MKRIPLLLALALAIPACTLAADAPAAGPTAASTASISWLGQSGLLLTPTADTLGGALRVSGAFHHITDTASVSSVTVGLPGGLEVGGLFYDFPAGGRKGEFTGSAKWQLPFKPCGFDVAAGWWDVADKVDGSPYAIVSRQVTLVNDLPLRLHAGWGGGIYGDKIIGGGDLLLDQNLAVMAEFDGRDLNGGIRWTLPPRFRVDAGYIRGEMGVGASVTF